MWLYILEREKKQQFQIVAFIDVFVVIKQTNTHTHTHQSKTTEFFEFLNTFICIYTCNHGGDDDDYL